MTIPGSINSLLSIPGASGTARTVRDSPGSLLLESVAVESSSGAGTGTTESTGLIGRMNWAPERLALDKPELDAFARGPVNSRNRSLRWPDSISRALPNSLRMKSATSSWPMSAACSANH
jgi:hypothetical protein